MGWKLFVHFVLFHIVYEMYLYSEFQLPIIFINPIEILYVVFFV